MYHKKSNRCTDNALSIGITNNQNNTTLYHKLVPGDILLTQTYGFFYSLWRKISCTMYDHTAVVLENNETLNVVYPITIKLPVSHFFKSDKFTIALRPVWKNQKQLEEFIYSMHLLEGTHYNSFRGFFNILNMMMYYRLGFKIALKVPEITSKKWVCTDAILMYLHKIIPEFSDIEELDLDLFRFGFTSLNDFLRIAYYKPYLLKKIE